ncbi:MULTISPECIES: TetR/AcrR family transcriptional regulator [Prauserella salsuginis group]|uniref:TetR family transcriptional regulator n=1 Tax=Prauserella salsuginis TaxID=387889 RepID=A0ABW6G0C7_9PSEU|nr:MULTISPECIES: TetR/AcrR family transcriptional regulator [Prauserella salsuginis group]MCR3721268.1 transcriptional regulator, TetR family [Prauserella flava]MCR3734652.1 transcriptional regulator, TetR family [Prauserella salsuginis]
MTTSSEVDSGVKGRILDAAAEAFMQRGFGSTTIDDIADDVGATKGLIYYHFRSKFDVFLAVYEEGMRRVRDHVEPHASGEGNGRQRLVAMSLAHVLNLMRDIAYHNVVHQGVRAKESTELKIRQRDALASLNELRRDYERLFHRVLAEGIEDGSVRDVDAALATRTLLSSLNAVDMWYRRVDDQSDEDIQHLARQVVDVLIGGIAAPGLAPA